MEKGVTLTVKKHKRLRALVELDAGRVAGYEVAGML
jgi:hypothetical protein